MKFCCECGYKLEGFEKVCPECGKEFKSPKDTEYFFESILNQFLNDKKKKKNNAHEFIDEMNIDDLFDDFSRNSKKALNRDADYVNRARKKLAHSNDYKRALYLCNKALLVNEFNWEAYYLKGIALISLGRYDEAIEELINSLALNKDNIKGAVPPKRRCHLRSG